MAMDKVIAVIMSVIMAMSTCGIKEAVLNRVYELQAQEEAVWEEAHKEDATMLAKLIWGEARGVGMTEQAAVVWCVLNRYDAGYATTIQGVITAKGQFTGYRSSNPVWTEHYELAMDVLFRWEREKKGYEDVGRVLPSNYFYFRGNGLGNVFRTTYKNGVIWDWSLPSPYEY